VPGPRPMPVRLKLLRGNPGKQRLRDVFDPPRPPEPPKPPAFLNEKALEEWNRVAPNLSLFGMLTTLDVMPLAAYCMAFARWVEAETLLKGIAEKDIGGKALLVRGSHRQPKANPLIAISREAASDMVRYAGEFGFSPAARSRIALGPFAQPPTPSKFAGLIAGDDDFRPVR